MDQISELPWVLVRRLLLGLRRSGILDGVEIAVQASFLHFEILESPGLPWEFPWSTRGMYRAFPSDPVGNPADLFCRGISRGIPRGKKHPAGTHGMSHGFPWGVPRVPIAHHCIVWVPVGSRGNYLSESGKKHSDAFFSSKPLFVQTIHCSGS